MKKDSKKRNLNQLEEGELNKKRIKLRKEVKNKNVWLNNNNNNNNNNKNNDQKDNSVLFFKIWRNKFLNNKITKINLFSFFDRKLIVLTMDELNKCEYKLYIRKLKIRNDKSKECDNLDSNSIPINVYELNINLNFKKVELNETIKKLRFGKNFKNNIDFLKIIPNNIESLVFSKNSNITFTNETPLIGLSKYKYLKKINVFKNSSLLLLKNLEKFINLKTLVIESYQHYEKEIDNQITYPINLNKIKFGSKFNDILPPIPIFISKITIGNNFNKKLELEFPSNLISLKIGKSKTLDYTELCLLGNLKQLKQLKFSTDYKKGIIEKIIYDIFNYFPNLLFLIINGINRNKLNKYSSVVYTQPFINFKSN